MVIDIGIILSLDLQQLLVGVYEGVGGMLKMTIMLIISTMIMFKVVIIMLRKVSPQK